MRLLRRNPILKAAMLVLLVSALTIAFGASAFAEAALTPSPSPSPTGTGPLPVITKSPTDETVNEGGHAEFVAKYQDAIWAVWHFLSPDGQTDYDYKEAKEEFEGLQIIDGNYSHMVLKKIPYSLNGWRVYCEYTNNNGSSRTETATITVIPKATPSPAPTQTPTPAPSADPDAEAGTEAGTAMGPVAATETGAETDTGVILTPDADSSGQTPPPLSGSEDARIVTATTTPAPVKRTEKSGGGAWKTILIVLLILVLLACAAYFLFKRGLIPVPVKKPTSGTKAKVMTRTKGKHEK